MPASYPPVGTRVRWTSRGKRREGVVRLLLSRRHWERGSARGECAFVPLEVWRRHAGAGDAVEVVDVDVVDGSRWKGRVHYYRPRPEWLEVAEEAKP